MIVHTADLELMGAPGVVAAYVIPSSDGLVVIDCGPGSTLATLRSAISSLGYETSDIRHILLTHIHLDHAGGAGQLALETGAFVYVHSRGAAHLLNPTRLMQSATQIYGAMMETLWGAFLPVSEAQLQPLEGGETLRLGEFEIRVAYTPGHAVHHLTYALDGHVFCGDVGGVRLQGSPYLIAPTPPPDIDLELWRESINKLRSLEPHTLYPTHFGAYSDVASHLNKLEASLNALEALSLEVLRAGGGRDEIAARIEQHARLELNDSTFETKYALSTPYPMAADGLLRYWKKHHPDRLEP